MFCFIFCAIVDPFFLFSLQGIQLVALKSPGLCGLECCSFFPATTLIAIHEVFVCRALVTDDPVVSLFCPSVDLFTIFVY